jgi:flagella basal body P-ring formation protein FlgA
MKNAPGTLLICLTGLIGALPTASATSTQEVAAAVTSYLQERTQGLPGTVSITVMPIDARQLTLQPCSQVQAFLPQGQSAWGNVTVGVRCTSGPNGSLYVRAKVRLEGTYVKVARPVSGGQTLGEGDVQIEQGELTAHPADLVFAMKDAVGQVTRQALSPGQALRSTYLQHETSIQAGQQVRLVASGGGFSVVNHGRALNSATRGALTRVKLDNGQIVSGIATDDGQVDVSGLR